MAGAYRGIVAEIPLGQDGLNASRNQSDIPIDALIGAEGVVFNDRTAQKEPGAITYGSAITGTPTITGVHEWQPSSSVTRLITYANGVLYKDDGAGDLDATTLASGLTASARPWFVEGGQEDAGNNRKLFVYTGTNPIKVLSGNGATAASIAAGAADWSGSSQPIAGVPHRKSIFSFGNTGDPHRWYKSLITNHEDYTTAVLDDAIDPSVGLRLCGAASYQGVLWWFKYPEGIFYLDDSDPVSANWITRTKSTAVGIAESPYAVLPIDDDILFMGPDGSFHLLSAVDSLGGVRDSDISAALKLEPWIKDNINLSRVSQVASCWDSRKKLARFGLPRQGSTANDATLMFDFADFAAERRVKFSYSFRDSSEAFAMRRDTTSGMRKAVVGGSGGKVFLLDQETRSKDGVAYDASFQTPHTDFRHLNRRYAAVRKTFEFLEVVAQPSGNWLLSVDVIIDGTFVETVQFSMAGGGVALDTFVLDTDALGGDSVIRQRKRIHGNGYRISFVVRQNGAGQSFSLARMLVFFTPAAEDAR